jgi:protein-S-isoprenylcysteine O-methyltransferase Ste14
MSLLDICGYLWLTWSAFWMVLARRKAPTQRSETRWQRAQHVVPLALAFALVFLSDAFSERLTLPYPTADVGVVLTALGLAFAIWARIHLGRYWSGTITLKVDHRLIRSGPYAWVRHPIYSGLLLAMLGSALCAATLLSFIAVPLTLMTFWLKIGREERWLGTAFGDEYHRYKNEVPSLIPHP